MTDDDLNKKIGNAVIAVTAAVGLLLAMWIGGCFKSVPDTAAPRHTKLTQAMEELDRKLKDPRVSQCFQAAFALGKEYRRQGKMKPSDAELHLLGLGACEHFGVPVDMRGVAVDKFKNGFGWGWSAGP